MMPELPRGLGSLIVYFGLSYFIIIIINYYYN